MKITKSMKGIVLMSCPLQSVIDSGVIYSVSQQAIQSFSVLVSSPTVESGIQSTKVLFRQ